MGLRAMAMKEYSAYSTKLQHYWNLTIILFSVKTGHSFVGGILFLCREAVNVFILQPQPTGQKEIGYLWIKEKQEKYPKALCNC